MQIVVRSPGARGIQIRLPSAVVLNPLTARAFSAFLKQKGVQITVKQAFAILGAINRYRRSHPEWVLVEVQSSDGEWIEITI